MTRSELKTLEKGRYYKVRLENFDIRTGNHRLGRLATRRFLGLESRVFAGRSKLKIKCAVFTSALRRNRHSASVVSAPHYSIKECTLKTIP